MPTFSDEEKKLLDQYVTTTEGDIFAIKNLEGIVGAIYARYSRAKTGLRETLLKEFVEAGQIDPIHAGELIERVLVAYGDDSVGELEGAHVAFENISILATKEIEDRRIGGSPIEKSTRYVFFDEKDEHGKYKYIRDSAIMASPFARAYEETLDFVFDTYASLIDPMQKFYHQLFPLEKAEYDVLGTGIKQKFADLVDEKDKKAFQTTYKIDLKTKACDSLRCLLPLATKTNVGMFGNGRYYQMLISHLLSTPYAEVRSIGEQTFTELSKVIPQYVKRAKAKTYNMEIEKNMRILTQELLGHFEAQSTDPVALFPQKELGSEEFLIANMLYAYSELPLLQIYNLVKGLKKETREKIKATYIGERETRRDRPGRALESGYLYTFDLCADFGTYKDLMRHRANTQMRQVFSPRHGFIIPQDVADAGFTSQIMECHKRVAALYEQIYNHLGPVASYVVLHGHRVRWVMGMNDRAAMHMLELRSTKQGHPQYRKLSQQMHHAIESVQPWRAHIMNFVDHNSYDSARGDSEARQRVKEKMMDEKFGSTLTNE